MGRVGAKSLCNDLSCGISETDSLPNLCTLKSASSVRERAREHGFCERNGKEKCWSERNIRVGREQGEAGTGHVKGTLPLSFLSHGFGSKLEACGWLSS